MEKLIPIILILLLLVPLGRRALRSFGGTECNNCGGVLTNGAGFCNSCGQTTGTYISNGTIWAGIIGEHGLDGLEIGNETPIGEAFTEFQNS